MYKIKNTQILEYIEDNFTEVEKDFLDFNITNIPEQMLEYPSPNEDSKENLPLITLLLMFSKVFGSSRELILNLKYMKDINQLLHNLEDKELEHLKKNNFRLLGLLAEHLGADIDFNQLDKESYQNILLGKSDLLRNHKFMEKNKGTKASVFNVIKYFSKVYDIDLSDISIIENNDNGSIGIAINTIIQDLVGLSNGDDNTLNPETELYKSLMRIKPAGISFIIAVSMYIFTTNITAQDNSLFIGEDLKKIFNLDETKALSFRIGDKSLDEQGIFERTFTITNTSPIETSSIENSKVTLNSVVFKKWVASSKKWEDLPGLSPYIGNEILLAEPIIGTISYTGEEDDIFTSGFSDHGNHDYDSHLSLMEFDIIYEDNLITYPTKISYYILNPEKVIEDVIGSSGYITLSNNSQTLEIKNTLRVPLVSGQITIVTNTGQYIASGYLADLMDNTIKPLGSKTIEIDDIYDKFKLDNKEYSVVISLSFPYYIRYTSSNYWVKIYKNVSNSIPVSKN